ncbi:MAG: class I SAM-dependent methyltransferase [Candidatus Izemoplasmatales bacterium]|jgi:SAM-dependent methyltransferase
MNTGEREMPAVPGTTEGIDIQHIQRYEFAKNFVNGRTVYDAACGCGYGSIILDASEYVGIDRDSDAIEFATRYYSSDTAKFINHDLQDMGSFDQFDVCISFETIEHLEEPHKLLSWISGVCDLFVCSSPIKDSCPQSPFHVVEYSIEEFRSMLQKYWNNIDFFVQDGMTIRYPCQPSDLGNVLAVCW